MTCSPEKCLYILGICLRYEYDRVVVDWLGRLLDEFLDERWKGSQNETVCVENTIPAMQLDVIVLQVEKPWVINSILSCLRLIGLVLLVRTLLWSRQRQSRTMYVNETKVERILFSDPTLPSSRPMKPSMWRVCKYLFSRFIVLFYVLISIIIIFLIFHFDQGFWPETKAAEILRMWRYFCLKRDSKQRLDERII